MALEVGAITGKFTLKDEFSKPMVAIYDATNKTLNKIAEIPVKANDAVAKIVSTANKTTNTMNGLQSRLDKLNERLGRTAIGSKNFELLSNEINKTQKELDKASSAIKKTDGALSALKTTLGSIGILALAKSTVDASSKFEKYNAVLTNSLRSQGEAAKAMGMLQTLAAKTPFTLDELTASYIKFVNRGLKPTQDELINLGDIAASQGKSFDQLAEAVLDAGSGEFERLKEFGIRASVAGNQVTLAFRGITQTVAKTPEALQQALIEFGKLDGVAGSMAAVSATLEGRFSNLDDATMALKKTIGDQLAPTLKDLTNLAIRAIEAVTKFANENPNLTRTIVLTTAALAAMALALTTVKGVMMLIPLEAMKAGAGISAAFGPASLAFIAIAALVALFVNLDSAARDARASIDRMNQEFNKTGAVTQAQKSALEGLAQTLLNVDKNSQAARVVQQQFSKAVDEAKNLTADHRRQLKVWSESAITSADAAKTLVTSVQSLNVAQKETTNTGKSATTQIKNLGNAASESANKAATGATNAFGNFVEKFINGIEDIIEAMMKDFGGTFEGLSEEVKTFIIQIANALGELGAAGINNFFQRMQNQIQSAQRKVQEFALISQVYSAKFREQIEKETKEFEAAQDAQLQSFIDKENERLNIEQQAANERVKIITDEYLSRKSLQDDEFARRQVQIKSEFEMQKKARRLEYEQKLQYLIRESADKEQAQIAEELMKQDWANFEQDWQASLNDALIALAQEKTGKDQELNQKENEAIQAQEKADADKIAKLEEEKNKRIADAEMEKEKRVQDFREKQKQREKEESKKLALVKYNLDVAALEVQKQAARATAALTLAQSIASSVMAGIAITAALAPFNPIAAIAIGASTTLGLSAIAASTYSLQMSSISSQFVLPPAELFLNSGGRVVPGAGMSDSVPARLTPGEMVIDRSTTEGLRDMVHSGRIDKNATININFMAGSIQNNGAMDERAMDELSYAITRRLEREYSRS